MENRKCGLREGSNLGEQRFVVDFVEEWRAALTDEAEVVRGSI